MARLPAAAASNMSIFADNLATALAARTARIIRKMRIARMILPDFAKSEMGFIQGYFSSTPAKAKVMSSTIRSMATREKSKMQNGSVKN